MYSAVLAAHFHKAEASNLFMRVLPAHTTTSKTLLGKKALSNEAYAKYKEKDDQADACFSVAADVVNLMKDKVAFASKGTQLASHIHFKKLFMYSFQKIHFSSKCIRLIALSNKFSI